MGFQLLSKLEWLFNETCKTSRLGNASKFRMHFIGSLLKLIRISEVLMHGRFFVNFMKSWEIILVTYKKCEMFKQFQPGILENIKSKESGYLHFNRECGLDSGT